MVKYKYRALNLESMHVRKKTLIILGLIFLSSLAVRLYFTYQAQYPSYDSYFTIRNIQQISQTGLPIVNDHLSYGGRTIVYNPLFHYLLAFFNLFLPLSFVVKVIPNIIASSIVFFVYLVSKHISRQDNAALFTSFISGFIPVFVSRTTNNLSPVSLALPMTFLLVYLFFKVTKQYKFVILYSILFFLFSITHTTAFIFVFSLLFYILLCKIERVYVSKAELELTIFSLFMFIWIQFLIFKKALLMHGPMFVWENMPTSYLNNFFLNFNLLESIYKIGIIPFIIGIFVIYRGMFHEKNKYLHLFTALAISSGLLLWLKILEQDVGLIFFGVTLTVLFSHFYSNIFSSMKKTKFSGYGNIISILLFVLILLTSVLPALYYASNNSSESPSPEEMSAFKWVARNTDEDAVVLAPLIYGQLINYASNRKNFFDTNFLLISDIDQRLKDANTIYTTVFKTTAIDILTESGVGYVVFTDRVKSDYDIGKLNFVDEKCFPIVYDKYNITIYKSVCKLE